jgi:hypothetical protein
LKTKQQNDKKGKKLLYALRTAKYLSKQRSKNANKNNILHKQQKQNTKTRNFKMIWKMQVKGGRAEQK